MEIPLPKKWSQEIWLAIFTSLALFFIMSSFDYSTFLMAADKRVLQTPSINDPCTGKYIYIQDLPSRFNSDLLKNCRLLTRGTENSMCPYIENNGLGPLIEDDYDGILSNNSWFNTNQFMLEVIFHNKIMHYRCLTKVPSMASVVFVPFYAGLDVSLHLWDSNISSRDSSAHDLLDFLSNKPEWKRMWGRDHFMVAGRISWDFRRQTDNISDWGSKLRFLPQSMNMSMLSVESSSWNNDYAIPYPTYFHPWKDSLIFDWQTRMRNRKRPYLFTFVGSPRPEMTKSIRGRVIDQCQRSTNSLCQFIDCSSIQNSCSKPVSVMKSFQSSIYCLQPPGDSYTRRSIFDSILAGCIPVFFHPGTAYSQYKWHFPKNHTKYSVYIPVKDVINDLKEGTIEKVLVGISKEEELSMRNEVIKLIPNIVYGDPMVRLETVEDAFDLSIKGIIERVEEIRKVIKDGKDPSVGFAEEDSYKFTFSDYNHT
ncbi:hypothetical protein G4B88_004474 [Cannabis sativa]|uniref:Exostosin GT47 domain-containing protein n=1 Tax=Cannabis sativa TaxID=3483 RepID=A0A7J6EFH5_CANSA|nr:hypothetical protein G4B88_004474 [Cannabis sativa]